MSDQPIDQAAPDNEELATDDLGDVAGGAINALNAIDITPTAR